MFRTLIVYIAFLATATDAAARTVHVPYIWSVMLLVIVTAFLLFTNLAIRDHSSLRTRTKNILSALIALLWLFALYYFR